MAAGGRSRVDLNESALYDLLDAPDGTVARWMQEHVVEPITQEAKRRAPVSKAGINTLKAYEAGEEDDNRVYLTEIRRPSGWLRSQIRWRYGHDDEGMYWDIESPARAASHGQGPYGLFMEVGTKPHPIVSHGRWPLRNRITGQVFGHSVFHPGTKPQPYLRPALDHVLFGLRG